MEKKYYPTIGLEIHAELKTKTKMFCSCKNDPDEEKPNVNICGVCMAHPGALPVLNKKAIENVIKVGLALDGKIADFTEFDRKNYFYPDIPKGYQISQYKYPIVSGGHLSDFDITRVHLEEDTANNKHFDGDTSTSLSAGFSLIDFNRAGVPLMELVTEPHTFQNMEEASKITTKFAKEFQLILWYLGVSEANMEKGEMRVEANISISADPKILGTKVEVKNLNSFRSVEKSILYEIKRMTELSESGKEDEIVQETRGWDETKQKTFSQRKKEGSADYRYFPDPDLPKIKLHEAFDLEKMKKELPELPDAKRKFFLSKKVPEHVVEGWISSGRRVVDWATNFTEYSEKAEWPVMVNFVTNDLVAIAKSNFIDETLGKTSFEDIYKLSSMFMKGVLSSRGAKDILVIMHKEGGDPQTIAEEKGLIQTNDEGAIKALVEKAISENPEVVAVYKSGKENAIMSLVGKIIKESNGSANPQMVIKLLKELLA